MDLTAEEVAEWEQHPTTKKVLDLLEQEVQDLKDQSVMCLGGLKVEQIALRTIMTQGRVMGLSHIQRVLQDLKEERK